MIDDLLTTLAIMNGVDEAALTAVTPLSLDALRDHEQVGVDNGRFTLDLDAAERIRRQLSQTDPAQYQRRHQEACETLTAQIKAGQHANEEAWTAVFERLANLYFAGDTPALLQLTQQAADIPLRTQAARQMRHYFQGVAAFRQSHYPEALTLFDTLLTQPDLPTHLQARSLNARAVICRVTGKLQEAVNGYQASLALWQELGDAHYQGIVNLNLGIIAYGLRHYDEANGRLLQAEQFFHAAGSNAWARKVQSELGLVQRDLGRWDEALRYFDNYVAQSRQANADEDVGIGEANRGEVLLFKGDLSGAKIALETALRLVPSRTYRVDHLLYLGLVYQAEGALATAETYYRQALAVAEEIERREILPHVYYHLADLLRRQGDGLAALAYFSQAATIIEESSQSLGDESLKISLLGRWQQVYEALILHCLALGRVAEAFSWSERARARAFADAFGERTTSQPIASVAEIQAALSPNTALLGYFTTGVLEQDMPLLQAVPPDNPLREHILLPAQTICFTLTHNHLVARDCGLNPNAFATQSPRGFDATRFLKPATRQRLAHDLLADDHRLNAGTDRLVVIPHGPLHRVPFTALFPDGQRPLLSFAPSGTIYARQRSQRGQPIADQKLGTGCLAVGYDSEVGNGRYLRYTEAEVLHIAKILNGSAWIGRDTKPADLQKAATHCRWLHIACHGWFNDADPLASYLEISADEKLTAAAVLQSWRLTAKLVALSACETGVSQILRGDEPMGLVRAFLSVGAQAVLVSQWRVNDLATFLLMTRFYQLLADDETLDLSAALHKAQTWLQQLTKRAAQNFLAETTAPPPPDWQSAANDRLLFADPVHWAGFILVGHAESLKGDIHAEDV